MTGGLRNRIRSPTSSTSSGSETAPVSTCDGDAVKSGRAELSAFFLEDLMLPEEDRGVVRVEREEG